MQNKLRICVVLAVIAILPVQNAFSDIANNGAEEQKERVELMRQFGVDPNNYKTSKQKLASTRLASVSRSYRADDKAKSNKLATKPRAHRYVVIATGSSDQVIKSLAAKNYTDVVLLRKGPYANRLSLGVFNSLASAKRRYALMTRYAVPSDVVDWETKMVVSQ